MLLSIHHKTELSYAEPISESVMELRMMPRSDSQQTLRTFGLAVGPDAPVLTTRSLANPGFESGFDGWDVSGPSDSVKLATSVFHSGGTSMRLESSKSQSSKLMTPVQVKQTVQLSGWAGKLDGRSHGGRGVA